MALTIRKDFEDARISEHLEVDGEPISSTNPLPVSIENAEISVDLEVGEVVTVTGGEGQTADVKVTLDGEVITISGAANTWVPNGVQADQALAVDDTAGGVQFAAFHADTTEVFWDCQVAQCRVTFDGSAPTASNGHLIEPGDSGVWTKALAAAAKFIRTGATSGLIHASQLKGA